MYITLLNVIGSGLFMKLVLYMYIHTHDVFNVVMKINADICVFVVHVLVNLGVSKLYHYSIQYSNIEDT